MREKNFVLLAYASSMTLTEEIFSRKLGRRVFENEVIECEIDRLMLHNGSALLAIKNFLALGKKVWDPNKIVIIFDHYCPSHKPENSEYHNFIRKFIKTQRIRNFFDCGEGICHQVFVENGFAKPYAIIVGGDTHSTTYGAMGAFATGLGATDLALILKTGKTWFKIPETYRVVVSGRVGKGIYAKDLGLKLIKELGSGGANYKAIEFGGKMIQKFSISSRLTLCNLAAELGAKNALINFNGDFDEYFELVAPDEPQVACPHQVDNVKDISEVEGKELDQVFIGTCTNGRFEDLKVVAKILRNKKVKARTIIAAASRNIYLKSLAAGFIKTFIQAGCTLLPPSCGPCLGVHQGVLGRDETCLSTGNRNFKARMGSRNAKIYLASPATAAASALESRIVDPREYL